MHQINTSRFIAALAALLFLLFAQLAFGQATLSIQGVIRNSDGTAVDNGKYDLTFRLYTSESGGTAVWSETQSDKQITGGVYSALLGETTPLTAAFDQTYYLSVAVGGGAEHSPRAKLTSSPYALSLIGVGNIFPSSGPIGAGTVSPTAGYQLHVKNAAGDGKMLLEGTTAGQIDLKKGSNTATIGFGSANNNFILNPGANNTTLQHNGSTKLTVNSNGVDVAGTLNCGTLTATTFSPTNLPVTGKLAVGQSSVDASNAFKVTGNSLLAGYLEVSGAITQFFSSGTGLIQNLPAPIGPAPGVTTSSNSPFISLKTAQNIWCAGGQIWFSSDRRIKKDPLLSNNQKDLSVLQKLRVTDYRYKDEMAKGTGMTKGFIAQEVADVFPEAVSESVNFLPDIYAPAIRTQFSNGKMNITLENKPGLSPGNEVKLLLADGEKRLIVTATPSENTFVVEWDAPASDKIFVYGKKVDDFKIVDYDRIYTLNVSATQELARKMEQMEKDLARVQQENAALKAENASLKSDAKASAEKIEARLRAIENRLTN